MENSLYETPTRFKEAVLWSLANILMMCLAVAAMSVARVLFEWSGVQWAFSSLAVLLLSGTWGSWAALTWTHHRTLRALMVVVTLLPGVLMVALGIWAFLTIPDNRWIWKWGWAIVAGHGVGSVAMSAMLGGRNLLQRAPLAMRRRRLFLGWTLFPVLLTAGSVVLVAITLSFFPDLFIRGDTSLETLLRWVIPSQALILFSTGLPAGCTHLCQMLSRGEPGS